MDIYFLVCELFDGTDIENDEKMKNKITIFWRYLTFDITRTILSSYIIYTGSPKKHENWKTTWELLIDILERIKDYFITPNI